MPTLLLDNKAVRGLLDMGEVLGAVEQCFRDLALGKASMPHKMYLTLEKGDFRAMPAALPGAVAMKWVNVHPANPARGLPTVMAVIIYSDPETGYPLAVMDGAEITACRTAAAAALASRYLARGKSRSLGIIGAGRQAYAQVEAHARLFRFKTVKVFDVSRPAVDRLRRAFPEYPVVEAALEEAAASDIVCTLTPSRVPYLKKDWLLPGTHINAVGADAAGKEELEPEVLTGAMVIVDDLKQAVTAGEINVPVSRGLYSAGQVYGNLGDIVIGAKPGRQDSQTITIFDSTGIAVEDVAVARLVYERASKSGKYPTLELV